MSYIRAGGTCVACPSFIGNTSGGGVTPPGSDTFTYDLSATGAGGNGMLNLLMFG